MCVSAIHSQCICAKHHIVNVHGQFCPDLVNLATTTTERPSVAGTSCAAFDVYHIYL